MTTIRSSSPLNKFPTLEVVTCIIACESPSKIFFGLKGGTIIEFSGNEQRKFEEHPLGITYLFQVGNTLWSFGIDDTIVLWDIFTGKVVRTAIAPQVKCLVQWKDWVISGSSTTHCLQCWSIRGTALNTWEYTKGKIDLFSNN